MKSASECFGSFWCVWIGFLGRGGSFWLHSSVAERCGASGMHFWYVAGRFGQHVVSVEVGAFRQELVLHPQTLPDPNMSNY